VSEKSSKLVDADAKSDSRANPRVANESKPKVPISSAPASSAKGGIRQGFRQGVPPRGSAKSAFTIIKKPGSKPPIMRKQARVAPMLPQLRG
jgi:hypothetical protein